MKIADVIQTFFGLIAIISFPAIFVSAFIFNSAFYGLLFFSLFWLCLPISVYMNKFTRNRKFNFASYMVLLLIFSMGLIASYFLVTSMLLTKTAYSFNLEKTGDIFEGSFNVPNNVELTDKTYTLYLEISYKTLSNINSKEEFILDLNTPKGNNKIPFTLQSDKGVWRGTINWLTQYEFESQSGNYILKFYSKEGEFERFKISSVKVIVKEVK